MLIPTGRTLPKLNNCPLWTRPLGARIGAYASRQSEVLSNREELELRVAEVEKELARPDLPRPAWWGGFRVVPERIELWQARDNRMHERIAFEREGAVWKPTRLSP